MKDKLWIIKSAAVILIIVLLIIYNKLRLPEIEADDISEVYYEVGFLGEEKINLDIEEFLSYYNQIYNLRDNKEGAGTTHDKCIVIKLKDSDEISIVNSGNQFEVNFYDSKGEIKQYWGMQQEIYNMLRYGSYSTEK